MWRITLRDLQFRRRQFVIAVVGAGILFGLALLLSGVSEGFRTEARETVSSVGADTWIVPAGTQGPFASGAAVPAALAREVARAPGARDVRAVVTFSDSALLPDGARRSVTALAGGRPVRPGTVVAPERLGLDRGERIVIGGRALTVGSVIEGDTLFGGQPVLLLALADAQRIAFGEARSASAIVLRGTAPSPAPGVVVRSDGDVVDGALVPMEGATGTIGLLRLFMWLVAAIIVGAITYLSALERVRDFAVLKAVGASGRALAGGVVLGAVLAALLAALLGVVVAFALAPLFPLPADIRPGALLALPVVAVVVGVVASLAAVRRVQRVDPALAFGT